MPDVLTKRLHIFSTARETTIYYCTEVKRPERSGKKAVVTLCGSSTWEIYVASVGGGSSFYIIYFIGANERGQTQSRGGFPS